MFRLGLDFSCGILRHTEWKSGFKKTPKQNFFCLSQCLQEPFVRSLSSYHFHGASSPFDRRITCLEWHPTHPTTVAAASKGGDIFLWDFEKSETKSFTRGVSWCVWLDLSQQHGGVLLLFIIICNPFVAKDSRWICRSVHPWCAFRQPLLILCLDGGWRLSNRHEV